MRERRSKTIVYVIGPDLGPYKIGITQNTKARMFELQTANWHKLKLHRTYRCVGMSIAIWFDGPFSVIWPLPGRQALLVVGRPGSARWPDHASRGHPTQPHLAAQQGRAAVRCRIMGCMANIKTPKDVTL